MRLYEFSNALQRFEAVIRLPTGSGKWFYEANNLNAAIGLAWRLFGRSNVVSVRGANLPVKEEVGATQIDSAKIEVNRLKNQAKQANIQAKRVKIQSQIQKAQQQLAKVNQQQ